MKWQPIETAPKDGTPFIGFVDFGDGSWEILRMHWGEDYYNCFVDATYAPFGRDQTQPIHWMPLPDPPSTTRR